MKVRELIQELIKFKMDAEVYKVDALNNSHDIDIIRASKITGSVLLRTKLLSIEERDKED